MIFEPGDVIRLKSGGPAMTVEQVGKRAMTGEYFVWCRWFEKTGNRRQVQRNTFLPCALEKCEKSGIQAVVNVGLPSRA